MAERILGVFAHPDDETFWCGGTLAQHVLDGDLVRVVILADGVGARFPVQNAACQLAVIERAHAFYDAMAILGVQSHRLHSVFPDQQSDTVPQLTINRAVESEVVGFLPTRIYTHWPGDLNLDHRRVAEAVLVAARMGPCVYLCKSEFTLPTAFIFAGSNLITLTTLAHELKMDACQAYTHELRPHPHPRSLIQFGHGPSESFEIVR